MRELWRIHTLALHPLKVASILLGIDLSLVLVNLAALGGGLFGDAGLETREALLPLPGMVSSAVTSLHILDLAPLATMPLSQSPHRSVQLLLEQRRFDLLLLVFAGMALIWAVWGGAVTRKMALDARSGPAESFWRSLRYCCKPSLFLPSSLASVCFFLILYAPTYPWFLIPVLPVWLYAGFVYGALTLENAPLSSALKKVHGTIARWRFLIPLQARLLASFLVSTGTVYAAAFVLLKLTNDAGLTAPVFLYALGYTTSNLKSLQVYLSLKSSETPERRK